MYVLTLLSVLNGQYGRVVRWTFGVLEVPGWNPAGVGASRRSRATSWALVGIPYVDSYLSAPTSMTQKKKKCSKICSAFGISYVSPYVSNTCSPFVPITVRDWPSLTYEWYPVRETAYATSTTTYCGMWRPATVASNSLVTAKLIPQSYPRPKYEHLRVLVP